MKKYKDLLSDKPEYEPYSENIIISDEIGSCCGSNKSRMGCSNKSKCCQSIDGENRSCCKISKDKIIIKK